MEKIHTSQKRCSVQCFIHNLSPHSFNLILELSLSIFLNNSYHNKTRGQCIENMHTFITPSFFLKKVCNKTSYFLEKNIFTPVWLCIIFTNSIRFMIDDYDNYKFQHKKIGSMSAKSRLLFILSLFSILNFDPSWIMNLEDIHKNIHLVKITPTMSSWRTLKNWDKYVS